MLKFVKINSDIIIAVVLGTVIRLVYIVSDEVWFDEIGNYRVNVKKSCHAESKGET